MNQLRTTEVRFDSKHSALEVKFSDSDKWWILPGFFITRLSLDLVAWDRAQVRPDQSGIDVPLALHRQFTTPAGQKMLMEDPAPITIDSQANVHAGTICLDTDYLRRKVEWIAECKREDSKRLEVGELDDLMLLWSHTTPGRWYPRATDDNMAMNARFVGVRPNPGDEPDKMQHDNGMGMAANDPLGGEAPVNDPAAPPSDKEPSEQVVAITLLQSPRLADADEYDANTEFIAKMHQYLPRLLHLIHMQSEHILALEQQRDLLAKMAGVDMDRMRDTAAKLADLIFGGLGNDDSGSEDEKARPTAPVNIPKQSPPKREKRNDGGLPGFHTPLA